MRRHTEREDLSYEAVVLEILVKVAFMAVQDKQSVRPLLARLCMRVKMLQPFKAKCICSPAILRD